MSIFDRFFKKEVSPFAKNVFSTASMFSGAKTWSRKDYYYGIVYSCIDAIATSVSGIELELYKIRKGDDLEVQDHPAINLLRRPNNFQTGVDLLYQISSHIDTNGKAVIYPVKNGRGEPVELWVLDPSRLNTITGSGYIDGYIYINPKGEQVPFLPDELITIYRPNPYNSYEGVSTIEMARRTIETDLNAQDFNTQFFNNGANPSGILSAEGALGENEFNRLRRQFTEKYEGVTNAYKTMVLEGGLKYQQVQLSQKDMAFVEQRTMSRDEILSIFKVPKSIVAITDDVNRANAETSNYVFAERVVKPRMDLITEKLNKFYLPMFGDPTLRLDFDSPVPEDKEMKLKYYTAGVNTWLTVNEVRAEEGMAPIEGGDVLTPASTTPTTNLMMTKSAKDRKYIDHRQRVYSELASRYQLKVKQHFGILTKDISNKDLFHKRLKGVEESMLDIMPDMNEWKGIMTTITFDFEKEALLAGVELLNQYYNFPTIDLESTGIITIIKNRAKDTSADVTNTVVNRAREIIARELESGEPYTLKKLRDAIVSDIKDTTDWKAERIARTEMAFALHQGTLEDMKSAGVITKVKRIFAGDPCPICEDLQGVYELNEAPSLPTHPNCRCDYVPQWG